MMRFSLFCSLVSLLVLSMNVSATNYYLSSSTGSDSNTGTSPSSPWQTTGKFNAVLSRSMRPGDAVYFCKGDTWLYSNLASGSAGVTYDSYTCRSGQTAKPVISTSVQPASGIWRRVGTSDLLVANFQTGTYADPIALREGVRAIWVDQVRYVTARFPALLNPTNTLTIGQTTWGLQGEFFTSNRLDGSTIYCNDLTQATDYWKGATIYVRVLNYAYLSYDVIASGPGFVTLHAAPGHAAGFYFAYTSSVSSVNTHLKVKNRGEFSFDQTTGLMYLYPLTSAIASQILSGSQPVNVLYNGLPAVITNQGGIGGVTIQNLHLKWTSMGIEQLSNQPITIQFNDVSHIAGTGIFTQRMGANTVVNNAVFDSESSCIVTQTLTRTSRNSVRQCGLYVGWGGWQATNGITCAGGECSYNQVALVGYIGISPTARAFVLQNRVDWSMLVLNDGGGIYGYGSGMVGVAIYSNIVTNVVGNYVSWTPWPIAPCYYLDTTSYVQLYNNTCTAAPSCVQMNQGNGHVIFSNVCNAPGMYINQAIAASTFMGNLIATTGTNTNWQNSLHRVQAPNRQSYNEIMTTGDNIYCIPQGADRNYLFQMVKAGLNQRYNAFDDWKSSVVNDQPSFERGTAVYTSCRGLRSTFAGNEISSLPVDVSINQSSSFIAIPIVLVVFVLIVLIGVLSYRAYRSKSINQSTNQSIEIELPQSSPTSASVSSFSLMESSPHTTIMV